MKLPIKLHPPAEAGNVDMPTTLRVLASTILALADAHEAASAHPSGPTHFSTASLPPEVPSPRAFRETVAREAIPAVKVGRRIVVRREDWFAWLSTKGTRRTVPAPVEITDRDAAALRALGVAPMRRAGVVR